MLVKEHTGYTALLGLWNIPPRVPLGPDVPNANASHLPRFTLQLFAVNSVNCVICVVIIVNHVQCAVASVNGVQYSADI